MAKKQDYTYTKGKRRTASARVRLFKGKGQSLVNDIPVEKYFPGQVNTVYWMRPFTITESFEQYYFTAKVVGSGNRGQLAAVVHAVSRALALTEEKYKVTLRKEGLLTRDSRTRQRRMIGMGGKSRRKKQSPKR